MSRIKRAWPMGWNVGDLLQHLGGIAPTRLRLHPAPGTATERDVLNIHAREKRLYELLDGVLVEKVMGFPESYLAGELVRVLGNFVVAGRLGIVLPPDGMIRIAPNLVRIPDVAYFSRARLPRGKVPAEPIPDLVPDLAVEVLSESNTPGEMQIKLKDYFLAGVQIVWFIDPQARTIQVFTAPDRSATLGEGQTVEGGSVLPGFSLPLRDLFAEVPEIAPTSRRRMRKKK